VAQLVIPMGIIVESKLKVLDVMGGGNAHMWHDHMYQGHALVATLVAK